MFNPQKPDRKDLPSKAELRRASAIAALVAALIGTVVVLPAERGVDPTGLGRLLGLTEMGEIKMQLAQEAEENHASLFGTVFDGVFDAIFPPAIAQDAAQDAEAWRDETTFTLAPGESAEWKLDMTKGQVALYRMTVTGGGVNYDLHGHGGGQSASYEKGRGSTGAEGGIIAEFDGQHGWFFRNRDKGPVTVTVQVKGEYQTFKEEG